MNRYINERVIKIIFNLHHNVLCDVPFDGQAIIGFLGEENFIEAEPVVHAHWTEYYGDIKCTSCGFVCGDEFYLGSKSYCPNCGAKMDEKEEG